MCLSKTNRFSVWDLTTCALVFHFKVKKDIMSIKFVGDDFLFLLTNNSVLVFSFEENSFIDELKIWEDEKTSKYIKDFWMTDFSIMNKDENSFLLVAGNETGKVIFWKLTYKDNKLEHDFEIFRIYEKWRVKRVNILNVENQTMMVCVSTEGHISVFNISFIWDKELNNEYENESILPVLNEKKMEVRITQLSVTTLTKLILPQKKIEPKTKKIKKKTKKTNLIKK